AQPEQMYQAFNIRQNESYWFVHNTGITPDNGLKSLKVHNETVKIEEIFITPHSRKDRKILLLSSLWSMEDVLIAGKILDEHIMSITLPLITFNVTFMI